MPRISVIMRSYNDAWVIGETLEALSAQRLRAFELINVDSGSTDGTVEIIKHFNPKPIQIITSAYKPGRVLNMAIEDSRGEHLVFLNSDATPVGPHWLEALVAPLAEPKVAATFGSARGATRDSSQWGPTGVASELRKTRCSPRESSMAMFRTRPGL